MQYLGQTWSALYHINSLQNLHDVVDLEICNSVKIGAAMNSVLTPILLHIKHVKLYIIAVAGTGTIMAAFSQTWGLSS